MKKVLTIILCMILALSLFCGCGAGADMKADSEAYYDSNTTGSMTAPSAPEPSAPADKPASDYVTEDSADIVDGGEGGSLLSALTRPDDLSAKMIYSASANIETIYFDDAINEVARLVEEYGGFIEDSYVAGVDYRSEFYDYQTYRDASFTIRVPKENYAGMTENLSRLGNVTSLHSYAENITAQYTDAEARLATYEAEEARLLEMVAAAETVEDLIAIETRLSEVRYNIEAITSTLRNWQNEIDYSTVSIYLQEVQELTVRVEVQRTFGEQIVEGLKSTFRSIGRFFKNLVMWFIVNLPVLIILAVIAFVVIFLIRRKIRKIRARRAEKKQKKEEEK